MSDNSSAPKTLIELLMEVVAPIVGGIAVALFLRTWTPIPTWACVLVGLPIGTVLGWVTMIAVFVMVAFLFDTKQKQIGEQSDVRETSAQSVSKSNSTPRSP